MSHGRTATRGLTLALAGLLALAGCGESSGGDGGSGSSASTAWVHHWNEIAIDASGLDHTPVAPGETRIFGEQFGPPRSARAMAIVHIAVFDAMNAIEGRYEGYTGIPRVRGRAAMEAAIAQAAYETLAVLYPSQEDAFHGELVDELASIPNGRAKARGVDVGHQAASAILALRADDGSQHGEPVYGVDYIAGDGPGEWRQDPISLYPFALGARWPQVRPFVLQSADQFRTPPPPALDSAEYAAAYAETQSFGGDNLTTPSVRTDEETHIGIFWAYDGTPSLCAPPRMYNQLTTQIAEQQRTNGLEYARLLALVNVAMADTAIAVWDSKYFYKFWRPVIAIRESDPGTGPTGAGDGNDATVGDPDFMPLGAPASNLSGPNFTPPFPAYPSGHAGFGGAVFEMLRHIYRTDSLAFTFVSDEFNGVTRDNQGNVRPYLPRSFNTLSQAEEENGQSRIYLGIHWTFDKQQGIAQGNRVADYVFDHAFRRRR